MKSNTKKIVLAAMLAALLTVATIVVVIPLPFKGYINLGDCIVLLSGWILSPAYAFFAAAIGASLADVISGYIVYAPATFIIKGTMAICAGALSKGLRKKTGEAASYILSAAIAELIMIAGYYVFEGFLYGFIASAVNIPANAVQAAFGAVISLILIKLLKRTKV